MKIGQAKHEMDTTQEGALMLASILCNYITYVSKQGDGNGFFCCRLCKRPVHPTQAENPIYHDQMCPYRRALHLVYGPVIAYQDPLSKDVVCMECGRAAWIPVRYIQIEYGDTCRRCKTSLLKESSA